MARPPRYNADYFPHNADMRNDLKVKALRRKFGHTGYAVWNYVLETLTDSDYFFIEWNDLNRELMAADYDVSVEDLTQIVEYCLRLGLLQKEGEKIYSSTHQARFVALLNNRTRKRDSGDKKEDAEDQNPARTPESEVPARRNPAETPDNEENGAPESDSKVKKSKEKKNKENEREKEFPLPAEKTDSDSSGESAVGDNENPSPPVPGAPPSDSQFEGVEKLRDRLRAQGETYAWHVKNAMAGIQAIAPDGVWQWLDRFVIELKAKGETAKTPRDFQSHFVSWLKSELRKSKSYGNQERFAAGGGSKAEGGRVGVGGDQIDRNCAERVARRITQSQPGKVGK